MGCGAGSGTGDAASSTAGGFTAISLDIPSSGNGSLRLLGYGGPLVAVDGDRVLAAGLISFDVSTTQLTDSRTLTAIDGGVVTFVHRYTYPKSLDVRASSIVADGEGGAFLAGNRLHGVAGGSASDPVVTRFDAIGHVLWSKSYSASGTYLRLSTRDPS